LAVKTDVTQSDQVNGMVKKALEKFRKIEYILNIMFSEKLINILI